MMSVGRALEILRADAGSQFDPGVVAAFIETYPEGPADRNGQGE
jgi:HD-GYP domain-containing protein (c-di-GMP phosphodiesterase class II)